MHDSLEDDLAPLLASYLASRLDGQLGKAARGFAALSSREASVDEPVVPANRFRNPRRGRLIAAVLVAAASVAVAVWCGFHIGRQPLEERQEIVGHEPMEPVRDTVATQANETVAKQPESGGNSPQPEPRLPEPQLVGRQLQWRTIDEGIVYLDPHTPVRKLRRQRLERVEWFDAARGARVQMVVPREEIQFVAIPST